MQQCIELSRTNGRGLHSGAENSGLFEEEERLNLGTHYSVTGRGSDQHKPVRRSLLVIGATEVHPVTSRTRSLRLSAPMVLGGRPPGRVGHRQETFLYLT